MTICPGWQAMVPGSASAPGASSTPTAAPAAASREMVRDRDRRMMHPRLVVEEDKNTSSALFLTGPSKHVLHCEHSTRPLESPLAIGAGVDSEMGRTTSPGMQRLALLDGVPADAVAVVATGRETCSPQPGDLRERRSGVTMRELSDDEQRLAYRFAHVPLPPDAVACDPREWHGRPRCPTTSSWSASLQSPTDPLD
jgi:hypothetical protein